MIPHIFLLFCYFVSGVPNYQYHGFKIVRFDIENEDQNYLLSNLTVFTSGIEILKELPDGSVDVLIDDFTMKAIKKRFAVNSKTISENVHILIDQEKQYSFNIGKRDQIPPRANSTFEQDPIFFDYQSTNDLMAFLIKQPHAIEFNIGQSYLGEPIRGVRVGNGTKTIVVTGGVHAREWISPATVTYLAAFLMSNDSRAESLRLKFTFHLIPVVNPDGYEYSRTSDRYWRKNRQPNQNSECIGTDINRNFEFQWGIIGADDNPCGQAYYGTNYFSAPEAAGLDKYISALQNKVNYLDLHSYGQTWLYQWGYSCALTPNYMSSLEQSAKSAVDAIKKYGTEYKYGSSCPLYGKVTTGTTDDHFYALRGVPYSMTVELRDEGQFGFLLPAVQILPTGNETVEGLIKFWDFIDKHDGFSDVDPPSNMILFSVIGCLIVLSIGFVLIIKKRKFEYQRIEQGQQQRCLINPKGSSFI